MTDANVRYQCPACGRWAIWLDGPPFPDTCGQCRATELANTIRRIPMANGPMGEIIWFTRESWRYMSGRKWPIRFLLGYPKALWRFMRKAEDV